MPTIAKSKLTIRLSIRLLVSLMAILPSLNAAAVPAPPPRSIPGIQLPPRETPGDPMVLSHSNRQALERLLEGESEGTRSRGTVSCLAVLTEFTDRTFPDQYEEEFDPLGVLGHPDSVITTTREVWFGNILSRVSEYYSTISGGAVEVQWTLLPDPVLLAGSMADYGSDDLPWVHGVRSLVSEMVDSLDATVDFSLYDLVTVIHAGPGQESDLLQDSPDQIWSGYIDHESLIGSFPADSIPDPPIANFPAIPTDDLPEGLTHFAIAPELEVEEGMDPPYVLGPLGVYVHQMGSYLGLINLNDYIDPRGQGAGNYDLMSSGLWSALGFVPGPPSAFNRMMMGWVEPVVISRADCAVPGGLSLTINSMEQSGDSTLLKFPISGREYFLMENREQDFVDDAIFTFDDANGNHVPDNGESLQGAEFDYFTTQYDANDTQPGSGLFIWRIDEEMVHLTFNVYGENYINAFNDHYGVFLLEADGYPDLSTPGLGGDAYGGDYDGFRSGENGLPMTQTGIGPDTFPSTRTVQGVDSGWRFSDIGGHGARMELKASWVAGLDLRTMLIPEVLAVGDPLTADIIGEPVPREEFIFVATNLAKDSTLVFALRDSLSLVDPDGDPTTIDPLITLFGTPAGSPAAGDLDYDGLADLVLLMQDGRLFGWSLASGTLEPLAGAPSSLLATVARASVSPLLYNIDPPPDVPDGSLALEILVAEEHHLPAIDGGVDSTSLRWFKGDGTEVTAFPHGLDSIWSKRLPGIPVGDLSLGLEVAPGYRGFDHPEPDGIWVNIALVDSLTWSGRVQRLRVGGGDEWEDDDTPHMELPFLPVFNPLQLQYDLPPHVMNLVSGDLDGDGTDELILEAEMGVLIWYPRGRYQGDQAGTQLFKVDHVGGRETLALVPFDVDGNGALEVLACETDKVVALSAGAVLLDDWVIDLDHTEVDPGAYTDPVIWPLTLRDEAGRDQPLLLTRDGRLYDSAAALRNDDATLIGGNIIGSPLLTSGEGGAVEIRGLTTFESLDGTTAEEDTLLSGGWTGFWRVITEETSQLQGGSWLQGGGGAGRLRRIAAGAPFDPPTSASGEFISAYGYPNPASDSVTWRVETDTPDSFSIRLYDLEGQQRLQVNGSSDGYSPWEKRSRLVGLAPGVYFYVIQSDGSGRQRTGRLAILR